MFRAQTTIPLCLVLECNWLAPKVLILVIRVQIPVEPFFLSWGCSSNGRASALHAEGTGIDTLLLHFFEREAPGPKKRGFARAV